MRKITSRTTMPSSAATSQARKSPPLASPRQTRIFTCVVAIRSSVSPFRQKLLEILRHPRQRLLVQRKGVGGAARDEGERGDARVGVRIIAARVSSAALL